MDEEDNSKDAVPNFSVEKPLFDSDRELSKRPRGILSHTDREYLYGLREYEHPQSESNRKQDIRERVVNSFQDYLLLYRLLDSKEREKIFKEELGDYYQDNAIPALIAFVYLGLDQNEDRLARLVEQGVLTGSNVDKSRRSDGRATNVDVSIDIEYNPDMDKLQNKLKEDPHQLTPSEIGVLVHAGKIDQDDLEQLKESKDERLDPTIEVDPEVFGVDVTDDG